MVVENIWTVGSIAFVVFGVAEMETEADGEEGISAAVHTQMQAKWKELSKKR